MREERRETTTGPKRLALRLRFCLLPLLFSLLLLLGGCGYDRPSTIAMHGTVTFGGQTPPTAGAIYFAPIEVAPGLPRRPARAMFDADGHFRATSFDDGDGIVPGTYRVRIECWKTPPTMTSAGVSHVPQEFDISDLTVETSQRELTFDINVPRAGGRLPP